MKNKVKRRDLPCILKQVLLSNQIAVFIDQLEIYKDHRFSFFLSMLGDTQMMKVLKKYGILGLARIVVK